MNLRRCHDVRESLNHYLTSGIPLKTEDVLWLAAMTYRLQKDFALESLQWWHPACVASSTPMVLIGEL